MNARKAVLADNPELILQVLQLRFDEALSYPVISAQTGVSKTAIFSLVRRFQQIFTHWPLTEEYSSEQLAGKLFPGRYPLTLTRVTAHPPETKKPPRKRFSPEFKWQLVQQTLLPGACVAQIARENGINDNLLFNWRHLYRKRGLLPSGDSESELLPVTLTPEPDNTAPVPVTEHINIPTSTLCCELLLPSGTVRLKGALTPALLQILIREMKGGM
ncbi:TPA: transposase [Salmonella enterica]|uniref:Transposase n=1 Tax=Salmonella enterica TaxID=28901 RepID=A0A742L2S9_SALER|nr:transposase [Salmonella enterica subsp. enterica serovar Gatow]HAF1406576.1 transposase [Salmonella enterica]HAF4642644.1 transposase [Salmonella enterica]HAF4748251.1 transposase [Salmonella enterica]HCM6306595.1 transposase [Salmonella enterica subsp. enterica serovar 6,14:y:1,7]